MSPLDRLRRELDQQGAQEWEAWRERKKERELLERIAALEPKTTGRPNAGRVLSLERIALAYRELRDADPPRKATKESTAERLHVHADTIDRTLRDAETTWRDFKRSV